MSEVTREIYPTLIARRLRPLVLRPKNSAYSLVCSAMDNSVTVFNSFVLALTLGKRHIADANQNIAEPHAVIIAPVSMYDLIINPRWFGDGCPL